MSIRTRILLWLIGAATVVRGAEFLNLGFDEPDLTGLEAPCPGCSGGYGPAADLFRGWTVFFSPWWGAPFAEFGGEVGLDIPPRTLPWVLLRSQDVPPLSGSYFVEVDLRQHWLEPPPYPPIWVPPSAMEFKQFGTVPEGATAVVFWGDIHPSVNGVGIPSYAVGGYQAADVSQYAGQEVLLGFSVSDGTNTRFDVLGFYPVQIPEPCACTLLALGSAVLWLSHRLGKRGLGSSLS